MQKGEFITLEGIEGAGKSSAVSCVADTMKLLGRNVIVTREPGGTEIGEGIRNLILARHLTQMHAKTELLLMFAARAQHLEEVILPALGRGKCVICDRFTDASYAYQGGGRGLKTDTVRQAELLTHSELEPDTTLLLDVPGEIGLERVSKRGTIDRFEAESQKFFKSVRESYLKRAAEFPLRTIIIDASNDLKAVHAEIRTILRERYA